MMHPLCRSPWQLQFPTSGQCWQPVSIPQRLCHLGCIQSHQGLVQITKWLQHMGETDLVGLTSLLKNSLSLSMAPVNLSKKSQGQSSRRDLGCVSHRALLFAQEGLV